jgi:endonuclease/exonuclease/phosphatase family metal-dependent hydrolase
MRWLLRFGPVCLAALLVPLAVAPAQTKSKTYLFCFWNVENLFDDKVNPKLEKADKEFDEWFAKDKEALAVKLDRMVAVLLSKEMNDGKGPDVIAFAEVESQRAVELVRDALNRKLKDKSLHYKTVTYKDPQGLRSIATAVLTRLKVVEDRSRILGKRQRILKVHVTENDKELVIIASHWTSRLNDDKGRGRANYADAIYGDYKAAYKANPKVDYLVCGDFNDDPSDAAVTDHLNATGNLDKVLSLKKGDAPLLFNPFVALHKANKGSHYYRDKAHVFDQICLSPGLLDGEGWQYVNKSAAIVEKLSFRGKPDRFGGPNDRRPWRNRGASDHYPVTIQLRVGK